MSAWMQNLRTAEFDQALQKRLPLPADRAGLRQAAVLILGSGNTIDEASVVLTHRSPSLKKFSGQMSFPGGHIDPLDQTPTDTAFREAQEEIGLQAASATPLGECAAVSVRTAAYAVHPILAFWEHPHPLHVASPAEVESIVHMPLVEQEYCRVHYRGWSGPAFWVDGYLVWGFTAGILDAMMHTLGCSRIPSSHPEYDLIDALARSRNRERNHSDAR